MASSSSSTEAGASSADRLWYIVGRWQEYEGEGKANLLRIIGIGAFYAVELVNYHGLQLGWLELPKIEGVDQRFHQAITAVAAAWVMTSLGVLFALRQRMLPHALKYASTAADIVYLTGVLMLADGPRSAMVVGYLLVIALAGLRFSLSLVWFATLASMGGYLFLLGYGRWYANPSRNLRVERYQEAIFLLALALSGIVIGQILRRVRRIAEDYARRTSQLMQRGDSR